MNKHIQDAVERFWSASSEEVKALCAEILQASDLPSSQQPRTPQDTALFLSAINGGLTDAVDGLAMQYLTAAGKLLIHEEK